MASPSQPGTSATPSASQQDNENWFRIASLVYDAVLPAFISVIHNDCNDPSYQGLPRNDADLYKELNARRNKIIQMKKNKLIDQHQYDVLLPSSGKTDSSAFDMTLAYAMIRNLFKFQTGTGWNYATLLQQKVMELSIPAYVLRGKELRNFLCHSNPGTIDQKTLDDKWKEGADVINGLKYNCDLNSLKNRPLDGKTFESLKNLVDTKSKMLQDVQNDVAVNKRKINDLEKNDELKNKRMDELDGRIDEKNKAIENISEKLDKADETMTTVIERIDETNVMKENIIEIMESDELQNKRMDELDGRIDEKEKSIQKFGNRLDLVDESLATVSGRMDETKEEIMDQMSALRKDVNSFNRTETSLSDSVWDERSVLESGTKTKSDQDLLVAWMSGGNFFYTVDINQDLEEVTKEELYELESDTKEWKQTPYGDGIKKKDFDLDNGRTRVSMLKSLKLKEKRPTVYKIVVEIQNKETDEKICFELKTNEIKNCLFPKKGAFKVHTYGTSETRRRFFENSDENDDDEVSEEIVFNCGEIEKISRDFQWYEFILKKGFHFLTDSVNEYEDAVQFDPVSKTESPKTFEEKLVEIEEREESDTEGWFSSNSECESSSVDSYSFRNENSDEEESIHRTNWDKQVLDNWRRCYTLRSHVVGSQCDDDSVQRMIAFISEKYRNQGVFIFPGYCIKGHDAFLKGRPFNNSIKEDLKNILVFIPVHRLILLIRVIESNNVSIFNMYRELEAHNDDIKVFLRRHSYHFVDEEHSIYPLLLLPHARFDECPKMLKGHFPCCEKLRKRIFLHDDLPSVHKISQKWEHLIRNIRQKSLDSASQSCRDGWKTFLSHVIGYMSTINLFLPNPRDDTSIAVKKIFLSHRQHHALLDDKNHTLITGSYGTGKSIMCQLKLVRLVQTLDQNHTIHFISFNESSLLIKHLDNVVRHLRKCVEKDRGSNHPKIITRNIGSNKLAEYLRNEILVWSKSGHTHHFIGDEFNSEFLTLYEARLLNKILHKISIQTHSVVSVSVIPLSKRRQRKDASIASPEVINDGYRLDQLEMKEWKLDKVFRITKEVYELMKATVEVIENNPTRFTLKEDHNQRGFQKLFSRPRVLDSFFGRVRKVRKANSDRKTEFSIATQDTSSRHEQANQDLDYLFKLAQSRQDAKQGVMIETFFSFEKCEIDIYHRTIGQKPNLITLFDDSESSKVSGYESSFEQLAFKVYVALIKTVRIEDRYQSTVIICTNLNEVAVCKAALEIAKQRNNCRYGIHLPTLSPSMHSLEVSKEGIIITDIDGVTGLEFGNVVIPVTESEYFMAFNLVQSLTRSLSQVHFLRFPSENDKRGRVSVTGQIIGCWRERKLIREIYVKQCYPCERNEDNLCSCGEKRADENIILFACQRYSNEIKPILYMQRGQTVNERSSSEIASFSASINELVQQAHSRNHPRKVQMQHLQESMKIEKRTGRRFATSGGLRPPWWEVHHGHDT